MIKLMLKLLILLFLICNSYDNTEACEPNEIHIREQWINSYTKEDGTEVFGHVRSEHCRELRGENYFQNSTKNEFRGLKTKFKKWTDSEKSLLEKEIKNLPASLKKYQLSEVLRATEQDGNLNNPAMTIPATKTFIFFDKFFAMPNKQDVIIHEIAHIAVWDIDPYELQEFFESRGWKYEKGKPPMPPKKVILDDSSNSPGEDFANSVELYYSEPQRLKTFNLKSFLILEKIIKSKEK